MIAAAHGTGPQATGQRPGPCATCTGARTLSATHPGRLRIALTTLAPTEGEVHPDCAGAAEDTATLLAALGHEVERADPPWVDQEMVSLFVRVFQTNAAYYGADPAQMEPLNREFFTTGITPDGDVRSILDHVQSQHFAAVHGDHADDLERLCMLLDIPVVADRSDG